MNSHRCVRIGFTRSPSSRLSCSGSFYSRVHGLEVVQLRYVAVENRSWIDQGYELLTRVISPQDAAAAVLAATQKKSLRDEIFMIGPSTPLDQLDINAAMAGKMWDVLESTLARLQGDSESSSWCADG